MMILTLLLALLAPPPPMQVDERPPEAVIRALMKAMVSNDVAAYELITLPDPRRSRLVSGGKANPDAMRELEEDPQRVQVRIASPYRFQGKDVHPGAKAAYPVGTTVRFVASYRSPMMVSLVRKPEGWKIDLRWWLAMMEMASGAATREGTPDYAIRALTASLISLDRRSAARFAVPGGNGVDVLFAGAPSQREPSGVLDALVGEMPLVEIGPGEFSVMPSGRIVEGVQRDDMKVLVGLFGSVEVPYVVRRIGDEWRVQPEPYFVLLLR
jgi:hypothetical protein